MTLSETTMKAATINLGPAIEEELREGYRDGFADEPEPGGNRSDWYRHGWLNGRDDRTGEPRQAAEATAEELLALARREGIA